jgi:hypothetical protein
MKKKLALVCLLLATLLVLMTACGGQSSSGSGNSSGKVEKALLEKLFPEYKIRLGMASKDYTGDLSDPDTYLANESGRMGYLKEGIAATDAELHFLDNGGLSFLCLWGCTLTTDDLTQLCGNPALLRVTSDGGSTSSVAYWLLNEKDLLIFSAPGGYLELYTEACAQKVNPTALQTAKSGLPLFDAGQETLYWYQDIMTNKYGLYDAASDRTLTEGIYDEYGAFDSEGMVPVRQDKYWGYINTAGEQVIGFYFKKAQPFVGDSAVVKADSKYGVIDRAGEYLVQPKYYKIEIDEETGYILVEESNHWGAYDKFGNCLIVPMLNDFGERGFYDEIVIRNGILYGKLNDGIYHPYDESGNRILPKAHSVDLPYNGYHIVRVYDNSPFRYTRYTFADEAFNLLSDKQYRALSMFSSNGYAVGTTDYETWEVIDSTGKVHYTFGEIADSSNITMSYTNGYLACGGYLIFTSAYYGVVDLSTGQFTEYANVIAEDGTSCVKVAAESGLWGLYEKDELLYPCVYDSISFDEETRQFTLTRGGEVSYYTPQ